MPFPLFEFAKKLEARNRDKRLMAEFQSDRHLARDAGLPYKPRPLTRLDQW